LDLVVRGGIELEDGTGGVSEGGEEGCEESGETVGRRGCRVGSFGIQKPLDDGDTTVRVSFKTHQLGVDVRVPYRTIKATGTEPESLPDVLKEEISFNLSLQSDLFNESDFTVVYSSLYIERGKTHQAYWGRYLHQSRYIPHHRGSHLKGQTHIRCQVGMQVDLVAC